MAPDSMKTRGGPGALTGSAPRETSRSATSKTTPTRGGTGALRLDGAIAQCAADLAAEIAGVHLTGVALFDERGYLKMQAAQGHRTRTWAELEIPTASIAHRVRYTGRTHALTDYEKESGCAPWLIDMFCGGEGAIALAAVPLRLSGDVVGVLYGGFRQATAVGDAILDSLNKVARLTSVSVVPPPSAPAPTSVNGNDGMPLPELTLREREMLTHLERGVSTREIAAVTGLTVNSVRTYIQAVLTKLGCGSRLQAVAQARALGLL